MTTVAAPPARRQRSGRIVSDQIKKALQDVVGPELRAVRADIRMLDQKIDGVDARLSTKIDSLRAELVSEICRLDARMDGMDRELRTAIDIRERLAVLEARSAPS